MRSLLTHIYIGPVRYDISRPVRLIGLDEEGRNTYLNGRVKTEAATIEIDGELSDEVEPVAIVHETLHAILSQAGIDTQPEDVIVALGYGIVDMLRKNPGLVAVITGNEIIDTSEAEQLFRKMASK